MNVAFGAERHKEKYGMQASDLASYWAGPGAVTGLAPSSNGFTGITPDCYGGVGANELRRVRRRGSAGNGRLTVGAAVRYEDFSEFGTR